MPGPMSAPNGNYFLTIKQREPGTRTGKTAKKRGENFDKDRSTSGKNASETHGKPNRKLSRKRREEQEQS